MQSTQRYVVFAFLVATVLLWATLAKLLAFGAFAVELSDPAIIGSNFTATTLIGLVVSIGALFYAYKDGRAFAFGSEVATELRKVTWPDRQETQRATVVVIITTIVISLMLGLFDAVWVQLTSIIYDLG